MKESARNINGKRILKALPFIICIVFFLAYATLSVVKHIHYQTGYDLSINDQLVWRYSTFQNPLTTTDPYPDKIKLYTHVEIVYALISPIYWLWSSPIMLLITESAFLCIGGIAVFLLAKKKRLSYPLSIAILISYLGFYGIQFAIWSDVHSASFGTAFVAWFIYFLDQKKIKATIILFLLAITAKENIAFITFFIALVYFLKRKDKITILLMLSSLAYLLFIFYIYFPHIIHFEYLYQNKEGLLSNVDVRYMFNSEEKLQVIFYSLLSFGFLPIINPISLLPALADLATYFVIGSDLPGAQGLFGHYRVTLAPLIAWATIMTVCKYRFFDNKYVALYLVICTAFIQYTLHLPLSYLTKAWFWYEPSSVKTVTAIERDYLPKTASVVAQVNILPHIAHRDKVYTLYPEKKQFPLSVSPCGVRECNWFRWYGSAEFLLVDTSPEWDARHLLISREEFIKGISNLEKAQVIELYKWGGDTTLYKINVNPFIYWIDPFINYGQ